MKRVLLILTMVISCSLLASCEPETLLQVDKSTLSFDERGGNTNIILLANKVWEASSNQSWCKVSPTLGDGSDNSNFTLSVSCDANTTYDERSCTITVICEELTSTITVKQAEGKGLIVSQTEYNLTNEAQTISVEVQANVQYTVSIDDACKSWIKQESTKGLSSNTIKFSISKNESYDGREGKITVKQTDGSLSGTVVVKQSQQNGLFVTTSEYNLSNEKHTLTVEVKANVEFDVKSNADWIKYVETKGLKTSQIVLDVATNEDYDSREGTVTVKQKNGNLEGVITIRQEQNYGILVSQSEFSLTNEAQTIDVEVKYNVDFDVVIPNACKSWISIVSTKGLSSRNYTISIAKNETYDNREGSITFKQKNGSLSGTVKVYQSQTDGLIAEKKEYIVSYEEQQLNIKVASNVEYEVYIDEGCRDWLSRVQTKGLTEETLTFRVTKNEGDERTGKISFVSSTLQETVLIRQKVEGYVEFEDANFKAFCVWLFDRNHDGEISLTEAKRIEVIDISTDNISSLKGIEEMPNLRELSCQGSNDKQGKLTRLDVSKNTALTYLNCQDNQLTSLDVSKNTALTHLYCLYNQLTSLDVSKNTALKILWCYHNQLKSLDVSKSTALIYLRCNDNQLKSLDVSMNTALTDLYCYNNQLKSLDVSKSTALTYLRCEGNQLTHLDVSKNTALETFNCSNNQLTSLDVSKNTALETIYCCDNQLTSLDVSKNSALTVLWCFFNQLTSLDVSKNTALTSLSCFYNQLTSLDVSKNTALTGLSCHYNQLKSLDVSKNTALTDLKCDNNQLMSFDVSMNTALTYLNCDSNQLTSLDVSKNTALTGLSCHYNQLKSLDVSKNTALTSLDCSGNQLTSLDVSKNTVLTSLWCFDNQLTSLDVSNNPLLSALWCSNNPNLSEIWLKAGQTIAEFHYDTDIATIYYK